MPGKTRTMTLRTWLLACAPAVVFILPAVASPDGLIAVGQVSEDSYRYYLDEMLYTHAGDDRGFGPEHDLAQANIVSILEGFGLDVALDPFEYSVGGPNDGTYYNVVATKPGTVYPYQEYIIGAHYDSVGNPGADDNASGVALVLEVARVLSQYDSEYTIRFIAFDREEQGLWGSEAYVQDHISDDILAMISADMVAYNIGANSVDVECVSASEPLQDILVQAVAEYADGLGWAAKGTACYSDHCPFYSAGFEACLLIEDWGNPYYHTQEDNVDMPGYIDYAFATKITRAVVGFLVDNAVVHVEQPDGDYDGDGDVDQADYDAFVSCYSGSGVPLSAGCEFFDSDSDDDVDCTDWVVFIGLWTGPPVDPPAFESCSTIPQAAAEGGRCLVVAPPQRPEPVALLVTGDPTDPGVSCLSRYVQPDGTLGITPVYQTSDVWGTVIICEEQIIPETAYQVQCDYGVPGSPDLSPAVTATTAMWGDTVGYFTGTGWDRPDGQVLITDAVAVLDKFQDLSTAPPLHWVDLIGMGDTGLACTPDQSIDILDAVMSIDGFMGGTYWASTGCPPPCPE